MAIYINGTKANNGFAVSSGSGGPTSADQVSYDNTTSGLSATDVQDAIDEIASGGIVGSLNDLTDVTISSVQNKQELVYNSTSTVFENKTTRIELTQAQYDALATPETDVDYYITDAPSMNGTSADLSYDGTIKSTYTKIEEIDTELSGKADSSDIPTISDFIRLEDVTIGTITIGSSGYVNISSYRPTVPTGFSFLCCFVATYSETSTKDGAMTVNAGGDYLNGAPNTTVTALRVRYVFIKAT